MGPPLWIMQTGFLNDGFVMSFVKIHSHSTLLRGASIPFSQASQETPPAKERNGMVTRWIQVCVVFQLHITVVLIKDWLR